MKLIVSSILLLSMSYFPCFIVRFVALKWRLCVWCGCVCVYVCVCVVWVCVCGVCVCV